MVDGLLGVVWALIHDICGALGLELAVVAYPHLTDGTVLAEQVVQVRAGDAPVTVC